MLHRYQTSSQKFAEDMHHNLLNGIINRHAVHCCIALYAKIIKLQETISDACNGGLNVNLSKLLF